MYNVCIMYFDDLSGIDTDIFLKKGFQKNVLAKPNLKMAVKSKIADICARSNIN